MKLGAAPPADVVRAWRYVPVLKIDAGACPVGTPDCCCERVSQDLDLVAGSAGGAPVSQYRGPVREVPVGIVHPRVAGIDVHKKIIWVAVRLPGAEAGQRTVVVKHFRAFWRSLQKMAAWLAGLGVTDAAMESAPGCTGGRSITRWRRPGSRCACATRRTCATCRAASGTPRTVSSSPSCTSTGCCGLASSRRPGWRRCGSGRATARSSSGSAPARDSGWPRCWRTASRPASVACQLLGKSGRAVTGALIAGERNPGVLADLAGGAAPQDR